MPGQKIQLDYNLISITILGHQNSFVNSKLNKPITLGPVQNDQKRRDDSSALVTSSIEGFINILLCHLLLSIS